MKIHKLRLVDRSRIVTDWSCPRKRFWNYEYKGRGITQATQSLPLFLGIVVHDSLAAIAKGEVDIDLIADSAREHILAQLSGDHSDPSKVEFAKEQAALVEGQLRGFYKYVWPRLLAMYPKVVMIEQEMEYKLSDSILMMCKPDLVMEDEKGDWHYIEYKTTSSKKEEWINSWDTQVQMHSTIKAIETTLGKAPVDVTVVGLYKGYASYGKQNSPFCYAYLKPGAPPFTQDSILYEYKAGHKKTPTWELEGGTKKWVDEMPDYILANLYPMTPAIYVNDSLVEAFFRQTRMREDEIAKAMNPYETEIDESPSVKAMVVAMDKVFPQKWSECSPAYGFGCEFKRLCHSEVEDPLKSGYEWREAHHVKEAELLKTWVEDPIR